MLIILIFIIIFIKTKFNKLKKLSINDITLLVY